MKWKKLDILRTAVTGALVSAAIIFGSLSYVILSGYEYQSASRDFHNIAHYALETLEKSLLQKEEAVLAMTKHMAYFHPNETAWPNVVWPGFYDSSYPQGKSAGLDDMFFLPLVRPDRLSSFEDFMYEYFASEPLIGPDGGSPVVHGVWSIGQHGPYHDTTGETLTYNSPNNFLTPMLQNSFNKYFTSQNFGMNMHCLRQFGDAIDALYKCSQTHNYTAAATQCVNVTELIKFPIGAADEDVEDFHTAILQPIYLNKNTSEVFGFIGGGFNWLHLLSGLTSEDTVGVIVTVRNNGIVLTFDTDRGVVSFSGFGDQHKKNRDNEIVHSITVFPGPDGSETASTYVISMYPRSKYYASYRTASPTIAAITSALLIGLCAATFFLYDYYVRGESEASAAVLETKRLFVRFISHEVRTPLNAVHLGLEALTAELRTFLEMFRRSPLHLNADAVFSSLDVKLLSWLELSAEMMSNSSAAEDVLDDLLNYDKIEMGTLHLEFSAVPIVEVVQTNTAVFQNSVKAKNITLSLENQLVAFAEDQEQQDFSQYAVVGDSARLAQVMRNLISNALKFTPTNGAIVVHGKNVGHYYTLLPFCSYLYFSSPLHQLSVRLTASQRQFRCSHLSHCTCSSSRAPAPSASPSRTPASA